LVESEAQLPFILAVEDHPIEQRLLQLLARSLNFQITVVSSGATALELLSRNRQYSIVLMDWCMPGTSGDGMNGLECTRLIRESEITLGYRVMVIAITAHAMLGDKQKCLEAGMDDYLSKPYTSEQFRNKILKWINIKRDAKTAG
jgi:two-component system sensor histidine kinase/response regulator